MLKHRLVYLIVVVTYCVAVKPVTGFLQHEIPEPTGQWCRNNGKNNVASTPFGKSLPAEAESGTYHWSKNAGVCAYGGPILDGKKVFVGCAKRSRSDRRGVPALLCFDGLTGNLEWEHLSHYPKRDTRIDPIAVGVCSSPLIIEEQLYYVGPDSTVYSLKLSADRLDFAETFATPLESNFSPSTKTGCSVNTCSPVTDGKYLFVTSHHSIDEKGMHTRLFGIDLASGDVAWRFSRSLTENYPQYSSPSLLVSEKLKQLVFADSSGCIFAFDLDKVRAGKVEPTWWFHTHVSDEKVATNFVASPVVIGERIFIGNCKSPEHHSGSSTLWCIDGSKKGDISPLIKHEKSLQENPNSGVVWSVGASNGMTGCVANSLAVGDSIIQVTGGGSVFCVNRKTGKINWKRNLGTDVSATPLAINEQIYVFTEVGDIHLFKDVEKGSDSIVVDLGEAIYSTPVILDSLFYFLSRGNLNNIVLENEKGTDKTKVVLGAENATDTLKTDSKQE